MDEVKELLQLRANKKINQEHIQRKHGKPLSMRNLINIRAKAKSDTDKNNIRVLVNSLHLVAGSHVQVIADEENV